MKTRHCDECKHFNDEDVPGARVCEKNHKPRWYAQKNDNPHDTDYGYKIKCDDYTEAMKPFTAKEKVMPDKKTVVLIGAWKAQREDHHATKGFNSYDDALAFFWAMANIPMRQQVWIPAGFGSYESNRRMKGQAFPPRLAAAIKQIIAQDNAAAMDIRAKAEVSICH